MTCQLLTTKEAAKNLGVSAAYLERDRWAGAKVPFIRLGTRSIRYRPQDLEDFVNSRRMSSTSEYQTQKPEMRA